MSFIGVASGSYEHLRQCGELIDSVLLALHSKTSSPRDPDRQRLANLLQKAGNTAPGDIQSLRFATLLKRLSEGNNRQWTILGEVLLSDKLTDADIELLESLAGKIEAQRAEVAARLRGETR